LVSRAVCLFSYADDGLVMVLVVDLILLMLTHEVDCGEDVRTVLNGEEPEVEVEVVKVIGFDVIPS
jgi:hypothetical protein